MSSFLLDIVCLRVYKLINNHDLVFKSYTKTLPYHRPWKWLISKFYMSRMEFHKLLVQVKLLVYEDLLGKIMKGIAIYFRLLKMLMCVVFKSDKCSFFTCNIKLLRIFKQEGIVLSFILLKQIVNY